MLPQTKEDTSKIRDFHNSIKNMEPIKSITTLLIISSLIIFINHVNLINAQVFAFGDCPNLNGKENFDLEKVT